MLESRAVMRHIQLKAPHTSAHTPRVPINLELANKPRGCVTWMIFNADTLQFDHFLWFGDEPGKPLPTLSTYRIATHNKRNASTIKTAPQHPEIPQAAFYYVKTIEEIVAKFFRDRIDTKSPRMTRHFLNTQIGLDILR